MVSEGHLEFSHPRFTCMKIFCKERGTSGAGVLHRQYNPNSKKEQCRDSGVKIIGNSAKTPVPSTRNSAVDYRIAASIGVTDVRVQ